MLGDPSRAMCGAEHRRVPKLVEERLGHGHFGQDLIQDRGGCSVVDDRGLGHLQPMEGELSLYLGQLDAGWRSEQRVLIIDREGALVQELGSTAGRQKVHMYCWFSLNGKGLHLHVSGPFPRVNKTQPHRVYIQVLTH